MQMNIFAPIVILALSGSYIATNSPRESNGVSERSQHVLQNSPENFSAEQVFANQRANRFYAEDLFSEAFPSDHADFLSPPILWNLVDKRWEMADCTTDMDCMQKYGPEPDDSALLQSKVGE